MFVLEGQDRTMVLITTGLSLLFLLGLSTTGKPKEMTSESQHKTFETTFFFLV